MTSQEPHTQHIADPDVPDTEVILVALPAPVFVDATGRRRRLLRRLAYGFGAFCMVYGGLISLSLAGGPVSPNAVLPFSELRQDGVDEPLIGRPQLPTPAPLVTAPNSVLVNDAVPRRGGSAGSWRGANAATERASARPSRAAVTPPRPTPTATPRPVEDGPTGTTAPTPTATATPTVDPTPVIGLGGTPSPSSTSPGTPSPATSSGLGAAGLGTTSPTTTSPPTAGPTTTGPASAAPANGGFGGSAGNTDPDEPAATALPGSEPGQPAVPEPDGSTPIAIQHGPGHHRHHHGSGDDCPWAAATPPDSEYGGYRGYYGHYGDWDGGDWDGADGWDGDSDPMDELPIPDPSSETAGLVAQYGGGTDEYLGDDEGDDEGDGGDSWDDAATDDPWDDSEDPL